MITTKNQFNSIKTTLQQVLMYYHKHYYHKSHKSIHVSTTNNTRTVSRQMLPNNIKPHANQYYHQHTLTKKLTWRARKAKPVVVRGGGTMQYCGGGPVLKMIL